MVPKIIYLLSKQVMDQPQPIVNPQPKKMNKVFIIVLSLLAVIVILFSVFAWMGLTKLGVIPNVLNIEFLEPTEIIDDFEDSFYPMPKKPVIYLYPEKIQDVTVQLDYQGQIIADYPKFVEGLKGWKVTAFPDGKLINHEDGKEYSYIFWEGQGNEKINWDFSKGFVVKGEDTREFMQSKLSEIGLTPKEYNEFIVYWYPLMKNNPYNLIIFAGEQYTQTAPLTVTPRPDSMLRVFMVFKPLNEKVDIEPQTFQKFERKGFTVVEWGGTEVK